MCLILAIGGTLGIVGKGKLDRANTSLWQARQESERLLAEVKAAESRQDELIASLRAEIAGYQAAAAEGLVVARASAALVAADAMTPEVVWRYETGGRMQITVRAEVNVRPAPTVSCGISFGMVPKELQIGPDYFYSKTEPNADGSLSSGNWIGVPVMSVARYLDAEALDDPDGVVWISIDYLSFSDWLRNYPPKEVSLRPEPEPAETLPVEMEPGQTK
ncbi:hypothetical protein FWG86_00985 [Candidatus Saccharibacteria bacterium]|nr:hypothetical protein [Candidatus Saccharibacteria bacterium]